MQYTDTELYMIEAKKGRDNRAFNDSWISFLERLKSNEVFFVPRHHQARHQYKYDGKLHTLHSVVGGFICDTEGNKFHHTKIRLDPDTPTGVLPYVSITG